MAVALTAELEPERLAVVLTITGIVTPPADTFTISRTSPSGARADVRGASNAVVSGPTMTARDYEIPFDTPVTYTATVYDGTTVVETAAVAFTLAYGECKAWLTDLARPLNSLPAIIESMEELTYEGAAGVHRVLDRRTPVLTTLPAFTPTTELIVLADTLDERDRLRNVFGSGYPFLLRTTPDLGIGNIYFGLTGFVEERFLSDGYATSRRFRVACIQVDRPDPAVFVPVAPNTYPNLIAAYPTYDALLAGVQDYAEVAYTYPTGETPIGDWPPDDI